MMTKQDTWTWCNDYQGHSEILSLILLRNRLDLDLISSDLAVNNDIYSEQICSRTDKTSTYEKQTPLGPQ